MTKRPNACFVSLSFAGLVVLARSLNPIPSRTRPLNSSAPMVLWLKPWESRSLPDLPRTKKFLFTCHDQTKRRFPSGRRRFCLCDRANFSCVICSRWRSPIPRGPAHSSSGFRSTIDIPMPTMARILVAAGIDREMIGHGALAVKRVDAAAGTEEVLRPALFHA